MKVPYEVSESDFGNTTVFDCNIAVTSSLRDSLVTSKGKSVKQMDVFDLGDETRRRRPLTVLGHSVKTSTHLTPGSFGFRTSPFISRPLSNSELRS